MNQLPDKPLLKISVPAGSGSPGSALRRCLQRLNIDPKQWLKASGRLEQHFC
jgi:hypothetical protein